jgi:alkaline phosphatase D
MTSDDSITRRAFGAAVAAAGAALSGRSGRAQAPAVMPAEGARPAITDGVASGDVAGRSAVVWSRADRPARIVVEWATTDAFRDARRVVGPAALPETGYTARVVLTDLPAGQRISYRVRFQDLASPRIYSHPEEGSFRTAPADRADVVLAWSGDTAGQGYGIDPARGGMLTYESIRRHEPHVFLHSGDTIYADNPIPGEIRLDDGTVWKNLTTEAKSKVAETLDEYRGAFRYNLLDEHVRRFSREVAQVVQWDDHETLNNWYPGEILDDPRYAVKSVSLLAARAKRAFFEFTPTRHHPDDPERIYRTLRYGPLLEVFVLDERSYRGPNSGNRQAAEAEETAFLGPEQMRWLMRRLAASRATWKVIASDMPLGLVVADGPGAFEAVGNGDGPPLGRELEIARLLGSIKEQGVKNVAWLTADVHYTAAHFYDPSRARFTEFTPFWEFVAGPLHAGTFGPARLDDTFGPEVKFRGIPEGMKGNRPPSDGFQFFGVVRIDGKSAALTVSLHNRTGDRLYSVELPPAV